GELRSPLFRALLAALAKTDVVVYVAVDRELPAGIGGHVSFAAAAGGRRDLRIGILPYLDRDQQIAMIGHELRHPPEGAGAAEVVDTATLADLYARIGFPSGRFECRTYDSDAAVRAGLAIARELRSKTSRAVTP